MILQLRHLSVVGTTVATFALSMTSRADADVLAIDTGLSPPLKAIVMMSMLGRKTKTGLDPSRPASTAIAATAVREYIRAVRVASRSRRGEPTRTRSSMDRASVFGTEGWGFESLRVHFTSP
jgi:hypothetical protein